MSSEAPVEAAADGVAVAETHLGRLQLLARAPDAAFIVDEPVRVGGLGTGPNPYDLLAAALASCTALTVRLYAERKGWPLSHVEVAVRHQRASLKARDAFEARVRLEGPLTEEQRARLKEIAERCPVHQSLTRGADVRASVTVGPESAPSVGESAEHARDMAEACED